MNSLFIANKNNKKPKAIVYTNEVRKAFENLKKVFIQTLLLIYFNSKILISLETDLLGKGVLDIKILLDKRNF